MYKTGAPPDYQVADAPAPPGECSQPGKDTTCRGRDSQAPDASAAGPPQTGGANFPHPVSSFLSQPGIFCQSQAVLSVGQNTRQVVSLWPTREAGSRFGGFIGVNCRIALDFRPRRGRANAPFSGSAGKRVWGGLRVVAARIQNELRRLCPAARRLSRLRPPFSPRPMPGQWAVSRARRPPLRDPSAIRPRSTTSQLWPAAGIARAPESPPRRKPIGLCVDGTRRPGPSPRPLRPFFLAGARPGKCSARASSLHLSDEGPPRPARRRRNPISDLGPKAPAPCDKPAGN